MKNWEAIPIAKSKAEYWLTSEGLILLEGWARDGLTDEQIAHNMGLAAGTLYRYKALYGEICEAIKKGKEVVDYTVENALYLSAIGGNVIAQIFWLKNRKADKWRDRTEVPLTDEGKLPDILKAVRSVD